MAPEQIRPPETLMFSAGWPARPVRVDFVRGDETGLAFPAHGEALREAGPDFLTEAFRGFGAIALDHRVRRITRLDPCNIGSTGRKFFLDVAYAGDPALPTELFVKFSRDFDDAFRDHRRGDSEAEIGLAALSCHPNFPIAVPRTFFADFHRESGTGITIAERIKFGSGGIEPPRAKCMDHTLANQLEYYRCIFISLARLAGAHKSGTLSPQLEKLFPLDAEAAATEDPISASAERIAEQIRRYAKFAGAHPQLLPPNIRAPEFIARLEREAPALLQHQNAVRRFLNADPAYIAFSHFNANLDNA